MFLLRRWSTGNSATRPILFHLILCNSVNILALYFDENLIPLNFPRPSVRTLRLNSCEFSSLPSIGDAPSKSLATSYEFVTESVDGSNVIIVELDTHKNLLYRPRHECFTTMYLHKYSGSSGEWEGGAETEEDGDCGSLVGCCWRLTKSIWGRYSRVWDLGGLGRRKYHSPKPAGAADGLCRDWFAPSASNSEDFYQKALTLTMINTQSFIKNCCSEYLNSITKPQSSARKVSKWLSSVNRIDSNIQLYACKPVIIIECSIERLLEFNLLSIEP